MRLELWQIQCHGRLLSQLEFFRDYLIHGMG